MNITALLQTTVGCFLREIRCVVCHDLEKQSSTSGLLVEGRTVVDVELLCFRVNDEKLYLFLKNHSLKVVYVWLLNIILQQFLIKF